MKKFLCLTVAVALAGAMFVGCSSKGMKDGTYKAEFSTADSHGWTDYVEVTVSGEKITAVDFDSVNAEGLKKSADEAYNKMMKDTGSATWPSDFFPKLEENLIKAQGADKVDAVAGATDSSNSLKKLAKELEKNISKGDTATVKVAR
ncbi:MAG: FMN-binding protein [Oscillospiraceae bacterium]